MGIIGIMGRTSVCSVTSLAGLEFSSGLAFLVFSINMVFSAMQFCSGRCCQLFSLALVSLVLDLAAQKFSSDLVTLAMFCCTFCPLLAVPLFSYDCAP